MKTSFASIAIRPVFAKSSVVMLALGLMVAMPALAVAGDDRPGAAEVPDGGDPLDADRPTLDSEEGPSEDIGVDEFRERREFEGQQRQDEAIVQLRELIDRTPEGDPDRAEYLYNLAEIYWERSRYYEHSAIEQQDQCYILAEEGKEEEARQCEFRVEERDQESDRLRQESIDISIEIIQNYPDFEELDEIYFELGSNLMEDDEEEQAVEIFQRLLSEFPETDYIPQARLYIGDYHFDEGHMDQALDEYRTVVRYPDAPVYQYARYKKGWAYFNDSLYQQALEEFLTVVDLATAAEEGSADRAMLNQVRNDIVRVYARIGSPNEAIGFFQGIAPDREDWLRLSERLAVFYGDEAQFADSTQMYRNLVEVNGDSHKVVDYQHEIVRNTATIDSYSEEALQEMVNLMKLVQAADDGAFDADADLYEQEIRQTAKQSSQNWANTYHREAQRTQNQNLYVMAHHLYRGFRSTFPEADDLYDMTYYHADLLYELRQWDEAARVYQQVVEIDPDGEYTEDAVHARILALFEEVETSEERADIEADFSTEDDEEAELPEPQEMPEMQERLLGATADYIEYAPEGEHIIEVKYHRARTFYDYNHFEEAAEMFEDIAFNHHDACAGRESQQDVDQCYDLADVSANLHLDTLNRLDRFEELGEAVARYVDEEPIDDEEFQADLYEMNKAIQYNICVLHDEAEEWEEAGHCYVQYVQQFPEADQAADALYNAALDFERINDLGAAIQLRQQLLQRHPGSEHTPETLYNLGGNYHAWAIYEDASNYYEAYVSNFPDKEHAEDALSNAATFRHGLQQYDEAIRNYEHYLELYGDDNPERAAEVFFEIAQIYEEQGRDDDAYQHYQNYIRQYGSQGPNDQLLQAHVEIGLHYWDNGARADALDAFDETLAVYERLSEEEQAEMTTGRDAAAEAQFMIGEDLYEDAEEIRIDSTDDEELQEVTEEKLEAAEEARNIYEEVIVFERPDWAIAALYRMGSGFQDFAETLRDSPVPEELTDGQRLQYEDLLEDQASIFEDQAVELYAQALDTARDHNWYNEYTDLAETELADLRPEDYRSPSELRASPAYQSDGYMRAAFVVEIDEADMLEELTDEDDIGGDEVGPDEVEQGEDDDELDEQVSAPSSDDDSTS